ncbi:acyl-CoA dehydrogenase family protein [Parapusillimonas granuli]|uniref:Acyl-CoA dehydrogenase family protein n=1 Tax=Parapusillimonas granuli TaxID=380911 RepID=A0A853FXU5_9BURK|nr:acyl-CoA dehydrogenase family protein [Parapusillimonas granuli]MBB5213664.1 alkylation response protein AidB-like acyl-CoA dehydrogenase [Parapusillimonas granuli]MEB2398756.1 acyl-CoA dehydrogenase family protein [Alcaligenaceae bacterium]NYT48502.1 acyl-CoA dehydrogenase family protein [Parapusillimonas granuli]
MIDFEIPEEDRALLDSIDRMMAREFPPEALREADERHETPWRLLPFMGRLGLFAIPFPEEWGGLGKDWRTVALVNERLAYHAGIAATLFGTTVGFGGMSLLKYGTDEQKRDLLPRLIRGEVRFALALTESQAGTDAGAIIASARRTGSGWVINGRKTWISNADAADYLVVACRTEPGSKGAKGVSMFLVDRGTPGISMTQLAKVGHNCMPSWDIGFDEVEVSGKALMGVAGEGFKHTMSTLHYSRAGQAANAIGQAQKAVDLVVAYAKERMQFGKPIGSFQAIQHKIADMQLRVNLARLALRELSWLIATERPCRLEAAQAKLAATETFQFVTRNGMQIMASAGYSMESDMQRMWRDAGLYTFGEGSSELQRNLIARELGL